MAATKDLLVRGFPADLKEALYVLADERKTNLNDVAMEILCEAFKVRYTPRRRRAAPVGNSADVVLRMPAQLKQKLRRRSFNTEEPMASIAVETLRAGVDGGVPAHA
jgi:hypothetical protein